MSLVLSSDIQNSLLSRLRKKNYLKPVSFYPYGKTCNITNTGGTNQNCGHVSFVMNFADILALSMRYLVISPLSLSVFAGSISNCLFILKKKVH